MFLFALVKFVPFFVATFQIELANRREEQCFKIATRGTGTRVTLVAQVVRDNSVSRYSSTAHFCITLKVILSSVNLYLQTQSAKEGESLVVLARFVAQN